MPRKKSGRSEARVTGIGGIFLRSKRPERLAAWYRDRLGISEKDRVAVWRWRSARDPTRVGHTLWAVLDDHDRSWGPGEPTAQVNYRVRDLDRLLAQLRKAGASVDDRVEQSKYGRFGWVTDPDGNRIELWEPPARYRSPDRHVAME